MFRAIPACRPAVAPPYTNVSPARTLGSSAPLADLSVMIIDPYEASRSVLRDAVSQLGSRDIQGMRGYVDAMRALRKPGAAIDVILCEYHLSGNRDGQQLLEELRSEQVISPRTSFLMVTAEASMKRVAAAAEFVPDGYVVKPCSVEQLNARLTRSVRKRQVLAPVFALIDRGRFREAAAESMRISAVQPAFAADCARMAVDLMLNHGDEAGARALLESLVAASEPAWAVLQLARLRYKDDKLDEAADMLERVLSAHPDYLRAHDALVDVRLRQGAREQAMSILKQASARSNANVARMRRLGNLAEDLGDLEMAEQVFGQVLERTRNSGMLSGEDYSNLSRLFVAQGKLDKLDKLANDQKKMLKGHKDLELSTALLEFHQLHNSTSTRRDSAVRNLIAIESQDVTGEFSPRLVVQVIRACLEWGHEDAGFKIATRMARRNKLDTVVLHEMQDILDRHRAMQRQSRVVGVDELSSLVRGAGEGTLDESTRRSIERSLAVARSRDTDDKRLDEIEQLWLVIKRRQPASPTE